MCSCWILRISYRSVQRMLIKVSYLLNENITCSHRWWSRSESWIMWIVDKNNWERSRLHRTCMLLRQMIFLMEKSINRPCSTEAILIRIRIFWLWPIFIRRNLTGDLNRNLLETEIVPRIRRSVWKLWNHISHEQISKMVKYTGCFILKSNSRWS